MESAPNGQLTAANPFSPADTRAGVRAGANMYGTFSIERFCDAGNLSATHEDALGWYNYVTRFTPANFRYVDAGVKIWAYYETYDNWQNTYGMDAVRAVYHSGHGGMDSNGVFYVPLGAAWAGNDCTATSNNMRLGNEFARYIFWSTCLSCRVLDGHNPIRTWQAANLGWRMLFGFETVSWDDPNYGKNFWEEWNKNKSFSTAWLDASWRIAHDQAPSVVACGASAAESQDRVFNERYFYPDRVSTAWWWWRWYNVATAAREPLRTLPWNLAVARLRAPDAPTARALADRFQLDIGLPSDLRVGMGGAFAAGDGDMRLAYGADGSIEVQLSQPNLSNRTPLATQQATSIAQEAVRRYGLDQELLTFDRTFQAWTAGGTAEGSGRIEEPFPTGTIVQFRQLINGLPIITPGVGAVRLAVDNDGNVTTVHSSLRAIEQLSDRPLSTAPEPQPEGQHAAEGPLVPDPGNYEQALAAEWSKRLAVHAISGKMPVDFTTVPGSIEIGYDIRGDAAVLIARKAMEVDFGGGYRKRYWITVPLFA
jgi:hypothetical protein